MPLLSLNELGEIWEIWEIRKICKQAIITLSLGYSFRKMFFIGQNLTSHEIPIMNLFLILMLKKPVF